jgi:hypothetical protein
MDNMTAPATSTSATSSGATPYPTDTATPAPAPVPAHGARDVDTAASTPAGPKDATPVVDGLIKRVAQSAHDAVDSLAAKASSVADGLQGGVAKANDTRDEWIESARDAIRLHPLATVAGALLIGAALVSLRSAREH